MRASRPEPDSKAQGRQSLGGSACPRIAGTTLSLAPAGEDRGAWAAGNLLENKIEDHLVRGSVLVSQHAKQGGTTPSSAAPGTPWGAGPSAVVAPTW